jgi:D-glycero-D-manno-heptose 1,7-bisphosphate phosphatase
MARWPDAPEQAVILARGGPILEYLVETCGRFGFRRVLPLAQGEAVTADGTAAALKRSADRLEQRFLLLEGAVFDTNWLDLMLAADENAFAVMALRQDGRSGGVALLDRRILSHWPDNVPTERLPAVLGSALVRGHMQAGFFLDPVAPESEVSGALAKLRRRPAVFFDRDGTLNVDAGYTHRPRDLAFLPGAIDAVKRVNDLGHYAFLVTNQSGVARGYFTEGDVERFHAHLQRELRAAGAHLDDIRYCPHHPEGTVPRYCRVSDWRKPAPGMLLDLMRRWPVRPEGSLVVGDQPGDVEAATAAGLRGVRYTGASLDDCLRPHLPPAAVSS